MSIAIVIPARMASTRFPGKPLVDLAGKPMIRWVVEAAVASGLTDQLIVATPDNEIREACEAFGASVCMTRNDHVSGTDRIAEVADSLDADILVNVQGDEPLVPPSSIRLCAEPLVADQSVEMATLYEVCPAEDEDNPAVVKLVSDLQGNALYFSRWAIPFPRGERGPLKRHVGMYAYRRELVLQFREWAPSPLEIAEGLEQLRFMENGVRIRVAQAAASSMGVDTPEQAEIVRRLLVNQTLY